MKLSNKRKLKYYIKLTQAINLNKKQKCICRNENKLIEKRLPKTKWTIVIYFRLGDCPGCINEAITIYKDFKNKGNKKYKIILSTDHPVWQEILCLIKDYKIDEVVWDNNSTLLGGIVRITPAWFLIKNDKEIVEADIIAPVKKDTAFMPYRYLFKEKMSKYGL